MKQLNEMVFLASTQPTGSRSCGDATYQVFFFQDPRTKALYQQVQGGGIGEKPALEPYMGPLTAAQLKAMAPSCVGTNLRSVEDRVRFSFEI